MWVWTCPKNPTLIHESHSEERAKQDLFWHVVGFKNETIDIPGCSDVEHQQPIDNGEPCSWPGCRIPYIHEIKKVWLSKKAERG